MSIKRRTALAGLGAVAATPWIAGCGGGDVNARDPQVRLLNASLGYDTLDLYLDDTREAAGVARGAVSAAVGADGSATAALTVGGSATYLLSKTLALASKSRTALVAYGWAGGLKTITLTEDGDDPDSGKVRLRVLNAAPDAGSLDVYITADGDALANATPAAAALAGEATSSFLQYNAGTWRIRATAAGNLNDLRMDARNVALTAGQVLTLVLVSGPGGVLASGLLLAQEGAASALASALGRVRVVASLEANAGVGAQLGGVSLLANGTSPTVGAYTVVATGAQPLTLMVNGTPVAGGTVTVAEGTDTTVLVAGTIASPAVKTIVDDNRLPAGSGDFRIRLLHGALPLLTAPADLSVDLSAVITGVAYGTASTPVSLPANATAAVQVDTPLSVTPAYSGNDLNLAAKGVYTVFLLTQGSTTQGLLRKER